MAENYYAPPKAVVVDQETAREANSFYVVSTKKFLALFLTTLGIYQWFWFYKNWQLYRDASKEKLWPLPRAIFSIFFVHSLFRHVQEKLLVNNQKAAWRHESLATMLVVLLIISNVLDRAAQRSIGSPHTDLLSIAVLIPLAYLYLQAQAAINLASGDPGGLSNDAFLPINYFWMALGAIFWILILIGIYDLYF